MTDVCVQPQVNAWTGSAVERATGRVFTCLGETVPGGEVSVSRSGFTSTMSPDDLLPLPAVGQRVSLAPVEGHWLGVKEVDASAAAVEFWVLDEGTSARVGRCSFAALADVRPPWSTEVGGLSVEAVATALAQQMVRSQDLVDSITRRLHQEADDRGYCGEFDEIMEEIGLPTRRTEHELEVEVEAFTMTVTVEARSREAAIDALGQYEIDNAIKETVANRNLPYEVID